MKADTKAELRALIKRQSAELRKLEPFKKFDCDPEKCGNVPCDFWDKDEDDTHCWTHEIENIHECSDFFELQVKKQ